MNRTILHIDMNSYFATVEQQANPRLRGKPVAVLGSKAKRTIIVASSIEAKRLGIKTGTALNEALELCPELTIVHGEPRKYSDVTRRFIKIFESYTDKVEIFSIDEAFLDITNSNNLFGNPENVAKEIKKRIREEIGSWISCSVGIAPNKFLAKLGSDLQKPDGLIVINERNMDEILLSVPLSEYCGIGRRIFKRLERLKIQTTKDIRDYPEHLLAREFGIATGRSLKRMAFGRDSTTVSDWHEQEPAKSFSCSRTLNRDVVSNSEIKEQIFFLYEKVAKKLRDENYWAQEIGLWIRFKDFTGTGKNMRIGYWTQDGLTFYKYATDVLVKINIKQPVRAIGVYAGKVKKSEYVPMSFLPEDVENEKIIKTIDAINNKYGEDIITRGELVGMKLKEIVSGMGRNKF